VLVDVTPYTFGTSALGELNDELYPYAYIPIIPRNTPIPVRRSEAFATIRDGQTDVDVKIYQGEQRDALENVQIGQFRVEGLSKAPAGNVVLIDLALDRDGILQVSAREKATGLERRITIDNTLSRYDSEQMAEARARIGGMFQGETVQSSPDALPDALVERARAALERAGEDDRAEIIDLIEAIKDGGDEDARRQLQDILFYLETG